MSRPARRPCSYCSETSFEKMSTVKDMGNAITECIINALLKALNIIIKHPGTPKKERCLSDCLLEALRIALEIVNEYQKTLEKESSSQDEKSLSDLVLHINDILAMAVTKRIIKPEKQGRWYEGLNDIMNAAISVSYYSEVTGDYTYSGRI